MDQQDLNGARDNIAACRGQLNNEEGPAPEPQVEPQSTAPEGPAPEPQPQVKMTTPAGETAPEPDPAMAPQTDPDENLNPDLGTGDDTPPQGEEAATQEAPKKTRRAPVRGVVAKCKELLAAGVDGADLKAQLTKMYTDAGREEKNAKDSASVVIHDVKKKLANEQQS